MPAAYAHDLYGRRVYEKMSPDVQRLIRMNRDCFYLGLHGPDILFFFRPLGENVFNQKGCILHGRPAMPIFEHGLLEIRKTESQREKDALQAYLLGFACHFALDHSLHGFIHEIEKTTGLTHGDIETELDRRLLIRENRNPLRTNCTCHLKVTEETKMAAGRILEEEPRVISESIMSFKAVNRVFYNSGELAKELICIGLRIGGNYEKIHGMIMRKVPAAGSAEVTDELEKKFYAAVPYGTGLLEKLLKSMEENRMLPEEFFGNFEGKTEEQL